MKDTFKINLRESILNLEHICLEYGIPISMIHDYKYSIYKEVILIKDKDGKFSEFAGLNENGDLLIDGKVPSFKEDVRTKASYIESLVGFELIPYTKIKVETNIDSILEKISKYGRNSLKIEEFDILYNCNNW